jgi:ribonuclease P protein component
MRRHPDFTDTVRSGRRAGRRTLVVHLAAPVSGGVPVPTLAGFVVSRQVGPSVIRHRVVRRLRPLVSARLSGLPVGSRLVVRALPPAAGASSAELAADLDAALRRAQAVRPETIPVGKVSDD